MIRHVGCRAVAAAAAADDDDDAVASTLSSAQCISSSAIDYTQRHYIRVH